MKYTKTKSWVIGERTGGSLIWNNNFGDLHGVPFEDQYNLADGREVVVIRGCAYIGAVNVAAKFSPQAGFIKVLVNV